MPGATKKDLHLAKNVGDLNRLAGDVPKCTNPRIFVKSADKLFKSAEEQNILGDEEIAYVYYMKFFNLITAIKKNAEYKKNEKFFQDLIGVKSCGRAIDQAEKLAISLKNRYDEKEAEQVSKKLEALHVSGDVKTENKEDIAKEKEEDKNGQDEKGKHKEKSERKPNDSEEKSNGELPEPVPDPNTLSVYQLYELLNDGSSVLVIDVRPAEQYAESHIKYKCCINIPGNIVPPGVVVSHLEKGLPSESEHLWFQRAKMDYIILLDWMSSAESLTTGTPIKSLKDAIYKWDREVIVRQEPLVLDGGYDAWLMHYPVLTTNASVCRPPSHDKIVSSVPSLDKIDYDLDLNFLKPPEPVMRKETPKAASSAPELPTNNSMPVLPEGSTQAAIPTINRALKPRLNNQTLNDLSPSVSQNKPSNLDKKPNIIEVNGEDEQSVSKPNKNTNIKRDNNVETPKPNRSLKPGNNSNALNKSSKASLQEDWENTHYEIQDKKSELRAFQMENARLVAEHQARKARLERDQQDLDRLELLKKKEAKETVELMRQKKRIQDELTVLNKEKSRREVEENMKQKELDSLKTEEDEKFRRLQEVDKMRAERKKKQLEKEDSEREAKEREQAEKALKDKAEQDYKRAQEKIKMDEADRAKKEKERQEKEMEEKVLRDKEQAEARQKDKENQAREERERLVHKKSELAMSKNLPPGFEKRLNPTTGRYTYLDHNSGTFSDNPPAPPSPRVSPSRKLDGCYKIGLKDESDEATLGGGLKRSHSSPNIAQMVEEEEKVPARPPVVTPVVDRQAKPKPPQPSVMMSTEVSAAKVRNLQPTWGNVGQGQTGLRNLGNTCYMNSTIQCLSHTIFLSNYFLGDNYRSSINRQNFLGTGGELAEEFAVLIKALWSGQYRSVSPREFKIAMARHNPMFAGYEQQDSQELLLSLMDALHEDLNSGIRTKMPQQNNDGIQDDAAARKVWDKHTKINDSIIVKLFQGLFKSTVTCLDCGKSSVTFDAFMYLSLPVPSSSRCTLRDCLLHFAKDEKMSGESKWMCPRCKCKRDAVKRMEIWKLPPILLIHLKRFYYQGMWRQKISAYVDFPVEGLDLKGYIAGPESKPYSLYGVSNHYGTMEGGHYTAYCKSPRNQKWCKYDDHEVYEISKSDIKSSAAYILFYSSIDKD